MHLYIGKNRSAIARKAGDDLERFLQTILIPLVCPVDRNSILYEELIRRVNSRQQDISNWYFIGVNDRLFDPLKIGKEKICFIDGSVADLQNERLRAERFIEEMSCIDAVLLGFEAAGDVGTKEEVGLEFRHILDARHVFLLAAGGLFAASVRRALEETLPDHQPAARLRSHPNLHVYLDEAAASLLSKCLLTTAAR